MTLSADAFATATPPLVEPVKDIMSISGWADIASPTTGPIPFIRLKTPAGTFASSNISAITIDERGAISEGFNMAVHPAARHGASLDTT